MIRPPAAAAALVLLALAHVAPAAAADGAGAGEAKPAPRAARSVHLWWPAPDADLFYNEVTVEASVPGSYFMACGFRHGYFGMQELAGGRKVVLFSVWDPTKGDDAKAVPVEQRVEVLGQGDGVHVKRFGGEGTGGQSFYDYDWKPGETVRFLVRSKVEGEWTTYTGWFYHNGEQRWQQMAAFRTRTGGDPLKGLYSFVEDFRRDGKSVAERRAARFGNGWARTVDGRHWVRLLRARFTADNTPLDNVDAALVPDDGTFRLATGGDTPNATKLGTTLTRTPDGLSLPPGE